MNTLYETISKEFSVKEKIEKHNSLLEKISRNTDLCLAYGQLFFDDDRNQAYSYDEKYNEEYLWEKVLNDRLFLLMKIEAGLKLVEKDPFYSKLKE